MTQTQHNESVLGKFVGFVLHQSWRVHSTHLDVLHFEHAQPYPEQIIKNTVAHGMEDRINLTNLQDPQISAALEETYLEDCLKPPGTCRHVQNKSRRMRRHTYGFLDNCQTPGVKESCWQQQTRANGRSVRPRRRETTSRQTREQDNSTKETKGERKTSLKP